MWLSQNNLIPLYIIYSVSLVYFLLYLVPYYPFVGFDDCIWLIATVIGTFSIYSIKVLFFQNLHIQFHSFLLRLLFVFLINHVRLFFCSCTFYPFTGATFCQFVRTIVGQCKYGKLCTHGKCMHGYAGYTRLQLANILRVESSSGDSLFAIHPNIEICLKVSFC